jgi:hypothetical protein
MARFLVGKYDQIDAHGHLHGAIIASLRNDIREKRKGKYAEYHLALCAHYVTDLSQPLHDIEYSPFNKKFHKAVDGVVNDEVWENLDKIEVPDPDQFRGGSAHKDCEGGQFVQCARVPARG